MIAEWTWETGEDAAAPATNATIVDVTVARRAHVFAQSLAERSPMPSAGGALFRQQQCALVRQHGMFMREEDVAASSAKGAKNDPGSHRERKSAHNARAQNLMAFPEPSIWGTVYSPRRLSCKSA